MELWGESSRLEGMLFCPEGAAALLALKNGVNEGWIAPDDKVLVVNSGNGLKYEMPDTAGALDISKPIDYNGLT
jgi:threonine synthase